mmetsp:Transcript_34641/g.25790  ORF Transcript_34641/g.25790 Transcript_34641/m.25790 type:complete len:84 (+) Transcript_34641:550-801(+)
MVFAIGFTVIISSATSTCQLSLLLFICPVFSVYKGRMQFLRIYTSIINCLSKQLSFSLLLQEVARILKHCLALVLICSSSSTI